MVIRTELKSLNKSKTHDGLLHIAVVRVPADADDRFPDLGLVLQFGPAVVNAGRDLRGKAAHDIVAKIGWKKVRLG